MLLKPLYKLKQDEPVHIDTGYVEEELLCKMSTELYHKLESGGCLPRTKKKKDSMVVSYGYIQDESRPHNTSNYDRGGNDSNSLSQIYLLLL